MYAPCTPSINVTYDLIDNFDELNPADYDNTIPDKTSVSSTSSSSNSEILQSSDAETTVNSDPNLVLSDLRKKNADRLIIGHLNINSLRSKFEALKTLIQGKVRLTFLSSRKQK